MTTPVSRSLFVGLVALVAALAAACSDPAPSPGGAAPVDVAPAPATTATAWTECQASDQAWVRRAILAIDGRRPWGQAEVDVYEDVVRAVDARALEPETTSRALAARGVLSPGRRLVAELLMRQDDYRLHWSDVVMDALHVVRIEDKSQASCYGAPLAAAFDDGALARWVQGHAANEAAPAASRGEFTMRELLSSSLALDDLSVVYRAHLFAMLGRPLHGANLDAKALEESRRRDFGGVFDAVYLHRNLVCLECHNSESSVTFDPDPAKNRAWPVRGLFERALFGSSHGKHPASEAVAKGSDDLRAHSMLRYAGVGDGPDAAPPYGWSARACGAFSRPASDPLLGVDTYFGRLRGDRASVWDLEDSLRRGVDALAARGLDAAPTGEIDDPDAAFAYLVGAQIVEQVWSQVMGAPLTVAHGYPRSAAQRDVLQALTDRFTKSHFSLRALLLDILAHPAFDLAAPSAGCAAGPYAMPTLFDPWTTEAADPEARGNDVGDQVFALPPRLLVRSLHRAMQWPAADEYPTDPALETALGYFLKDAAPGFRGLDFQGRLDWESRYGACAPEAPDDFVARIVATAGGAKDATLGDAVVALKDRLLGEPGIGADERPVLEGLVGGSLDGRASDDLDAKLRRVCGVLVSSPQFMLGGLVSDDARDVPRLTPPEHDYAASCRAVAGAARAAGYVVSCEGAGLRVAESARAERVRRRP